MTITAPVADTQETVYGRLNTSGILKGLVGSDSDNLIDASMRWPDLRDQATKLPRLVYRVPVVIPIVGLARASASVHWFVAWDSEDIARSIEQEMRVLFDDEWWLNGEVRTWSQITGGGEDPQVEDDDPIHQFIEVEISGS